MSGATLLGSPARARGGSGPGLYPMLLAFYGLWLVGALAGLGGPMRAGFPAVAACIAAFLLNAGRRADFLAFVLWLFLLTPGLRRFVDVQAGFTQVNLLMLAPYAAGVLAVPPVARMLWRDRFAFSGLYAVVICCSLYGLVIGVLEGRLFAAVFEALRWIVPPCFGLLVALDAARNAEYRAALTRTMLYALVVVSLYGVYQFIVAPPWDTLWMIESKLLSIGYPEPFKIRVFSTMNSPASLAAYLLAGLLWAIPARSAMRPLSIGAGLVGLLLTLVRTSWLGLVVGVAFLVVFGASARARLNIVVGLLCLPLVVLAVEQIPTGAEIINSRIGSLSNVSNDISYLDRASSYAEFFDEVLPEAPFGTGLGGSGSYQTYVDARSSKWVDGAIMEIGMSLGVLAGGAYLLALLAVAGCACLNGVRARDPFLSSCAAIVAALTLSLAGGNVSVGETGMLFWLSASFCLVRRGAARRA